MISLIQGVEVSGIVTIRDRLLQRKNPLRLESGEPAFDTPEHIKAAAVEALARNETHYVNSQGILPLRRALGEKLAMRNGMKAECEEILITNGGMQGLYAVFSAILDAGDEVLIPTPHWTCAQWLIRMTGGAPVHVPLLPERGFLFDPDALAAAVTPRTKAIMINSPHNPTGAVWPEEALRDLLDFAREHDLYLVSDEAYEDIVYDGAVHVSPASLVENDPGMKERVISVFTFSKSFAMTGWRLGYAVTSNRALMASMKKVALYTGNGVNSITQWAGIAAVEGPRDFLADMLTGFKTNRDRLVEGIRGARFLSLEQSPPGAFYCFAKIAEDWPGYEGDASDHAFANYLIDKGNMGCTPGSIFGPGGRGYLRFSYACAPDQVERAVARLRQLA